MPKRNLGLQLGAVIDRRAFAWGKSLRSIEEEIGWRLDSLVQGKAVLNLEQVEELAAVLETSPLELLTDLYTEPEPGSAADLPEGLLDLIKERATLLEETAEALQQGQALLAVPSEAEIAAMRQGEAPLTREAYLMSLLQAASARVENVAQDLITNLGYGFKPQDIDQTPALFNALETAVKRLVAPGTSGRP